ncbi:response regulator [Flavobacterium sp. TMP13]|uniref:response regulator n=1 Tax=Flavobacterium sp. TMP13 TaxID=3425950 RepID=UPI003D77CD63
MSNTNKSKKIQQSILIVDDHPFIIEGYKNGIARYKSDEYEFSITQAKDCESAYNIITGSTVNPFDIAFLDISMPAYEEKNIFTGEDLAKLINAKMGTCKVILLTMFTEMLKIKTIIKKINPSGLIIKNDLTFDELLFGFDKVINNEKYYSKSVLKMLQQSKNNAIELDQFDREILFHLSKGTEDKEFPKYIPITLSAIERRKVELKKLFKIKSGLDSELIKEAKLKGFI